MFSRATRAASLHFVLRTLFTTRSTAKRRASTPTHESKRVMNDLTLGQRVWLRVVMIVGFPFFFFAYLLMDKRERDALKKKARESRRNAATRAPTVSG